MAENVPKPEAAKAQPKTIAEWRKAKDSALQSTLRAFSDTTELAELGVAKCLELHDAVQPINPNDDRCLLDFMMLGTHRVLLNSLELILERQNLEAMACLRPAIEMAADAAKIAADPKLARIWLQREKDEGAFNKAFKPQFPKGDTLTGPLYPTYKLACNFGSHSNASLFVMHTTIDKTKKAGDVFYFLPEDLSLRRHLVHFVVTVARLLEIYVAGLQPMTKKDLAALVAVWKNTVDVHKEKYRQLFKEVE